MTHFPYSLKVHKKVTLKGPPSSRNPVRRDRPWEDGVTAESRLGSHTHLSTGLSLLVLLLLETELLEAAEPFQEGLLEFISADFWKTSMVALAMFSSRE